MNSASLMTQGTTTEKDTKGAQTEAKKEAYVTIQNKMDLEWREGNTRTITEGKRTRSRGRLGAIGQK